MKVILPCGPLNIKHMKNKLYTYIQIANTNGDSVLKKGVYDFNMIVGHIFDNFKMILF